MPGKLIIYRGLPASGKTTLAKKLVQEQLASGVKAINIDRDQFRIASGFGVAPTGDFEAMVTAQQQAIIKHALTKDWIVVESSTNLRSNLLKALITQAEKLGAPVQVITLNTTIEECIVRDKSRAINGGHMVGEKVIRDMAKKFMPQGKLLPVHIQEAAKVESYIADLSKPSAIIVDIDGTIAQIDKRSPYDYSLVSTDLPKLWVIKLVRTAYYTAGCGLIFMSGRDSACRQDTLDWIGKHIGIKDFLLYMRPHTDTRNDAIIKLELFNNHVRNNFNVLYCIDDRQRVIEAYRSIGLNVLDVAGHTF